MAQRPATLPETTVQDVAIMASLSRSIFEVRMRRNGRVFSRHYTTRTPEQAAERARNMGTIIGVQKVRSDHVIGLIEHIAIDQITSSNPVQIPTTIESQSLDSIVFGKKSRRRLNNAKKEERRAEREKRQDE
jgi:hypothetical protein